MAVTICGFVSLAFRGAIDAAGNLSGNVATNGGTPVLSDSLAGSCNATSCQGHTASTGELSFTLTNTNEDPFDGSWGLTVKCGNAILVTGGGFLPNGCIPSSPPPHPSY